MKRWLVLILLSLLSACGSTNTATSEPTAAASPTPLAQVGSLRIEAAYVRPAPRIEAPTITMDHSMPGMDHSMPAAGNSSVGAAFLQIRNTGQSADTLVAVATDAAERAELHETVIENNFAKMLARPDGLAVPAQGQLVFGPGGNHIMLVGLKQSLTAGMTVKLTLSFAQAGSVSVVVPVQTGP